MQSTTDDSQTIFEFASSNGWGDVCLAVLRIAWMAERDKPDAENAISKLLDTLFGRDAQGASRVRKDRGRWGNVQQDRRIGYLTPESRADLTFDLANGRGWANLSTLINSILKGSYEGGPEIDNAAVSGLYDAPLPPWVDALVEVHILPCLKVAANAAPTKEGWQAAGYLELVTRAMQLCVRCLHRDGPVRDAVYDALYFLLDAEGGNNMNTHRAAGMLPTDDRARRFEGSFARFPASGAGSVLVSQLNTFGETGGYDVLIRRLVTRMGRGVSLKMTQRFMQSVVGRSWRLMTHRVYERVYPRLVEAVLLRLGSEPRSERISPTSQRFESTILETLSSLS